MLSVEKDLKRSTSLKRFGSWGDIMSTRGSDKNSSPVSWNRSLIYLKPHADCKQTRDFIQKYLKSRKCRVVSEGAVLGAEVSDVFDKQYTDICKKAISLQPHECSLSSTSMMKFEKKFQIAWSVAVRKKLVQNSHGSCEVLDISPIMLHEAWLDSVSNGKMVKLGRGFYCSLIDTIPDKPAVFCINGFYAAMRAEYLAAGASVHYFVVEWDNEAMSWDEFRKKVVGSTNPSLAHPDSLRSIMSADWEGLGLESPMNMMRNGVHASASAFEAMVERSIWMKITPELDDYWPQLIDAGLTPDILRCWITNVFVMGKTVFDHMEDKGSRECIETVRHLLSRALKRK